MGIFASSSAATAPKTKNVASIALLFAAVLLVMAVAQLFAFEEFSPAMAALNLPGGEPAGYGIAALIVASEVMALPFLLRMRTSRAFRAASMVAGWAVAILWVGITLWEVITISTGNSLLIGVVVSLPIGWWNVCIALSLGVLAAWASWGMWPLKKKVKN